MTKKLSTRQRILQESLKLFSKFGFHATTFQKIADEVGITQPGIFIHFKNKMELFAALREEVAVSNRTFVDAQITIQDSAFEALAKHCRLNLEWVVKNPDQAQLIVLLYHYSCFDAKMRELNHKALQAGEERILKYVLSALREKSIGVKSPEKAASDVHSYVIGQSIKFLAFAKKPSSEHIEQELKRFLEGYF